MREKTDKLLDLIEDYFYLTKVVLPSMARKVKHDWPMREDHCFQRIVLDNVCGGVAYEHLTALPTSTSRTARQQVRWGFAKKFCMGGQISTI